MAVLRRDEDGAKKDFHPDDFRMTVGEHLDDLRHRLILALVGFAIAAAVCLYFGRTVIFPLFTRPLTVTQQQMGLPPGLFSDEVADVFNSYLHISLISAAAVASPWILWQFWQFVAAGLFPHERQYITKYIPLSIGLLISGMLFVYFFVLPWTLQFFIAFSIGVPLNQPTTAPVDMNPPTSQPSFVQVVRGNPPDLKEGQIWYDQLQQRLKLFLDDQVRVVSFSAENLIATEYKLPAYIDLVVGMLITFGLSFQLPLVVLALVRVGIVNREALKAGRQYVYFGIAVLAAVITPGDYITGTVLLILPLICLYELGIWLARNPKPLPQ